MNRTSDSAGRTGIALTEKQRIAWLRLIRTDNVGPQTFRDLINQFGTADRALAALPDLSVRGGATRPIRVAGIEDAEKEIADAAKLGARFIGIGEPDFPEPLRHIDAPPPLLCVRSNQISVLARPALALVGSRNCSVVGAKFAALLARDMGQAGYVVTSGLARGIDASAHRAAVQTGTIAAMAGGIDRPYPPENIPLADEIVAAGGALVSEMPLNWEPRARDFPRRNRLIAGMALGLCVIEAAKGSGSLITARYAAQFGRLVFAVPGSPLDPRCFGTNNLIRDGAILVTQGSDIIEALDPLSRRDLFSTETLDEPFGEDDNRLEPPPGDHERQAILDALGPTPALVDDVIRHTGIPAQVVLMVLLELDLAGRLNRHRGGLVSLDP